MNNVIIVVVMSMDERGRIIAKFSDRALDGLRVEQLKALIAMVEGKRLSDVAAEAGVGESTVRKWLRDDTFAEEFERLRAQYYNECLQRAIAVLRDHLDNGGRAEQARAAGIILKYDALLRLRDSRRVVEFRGVERLRELLRESSDGDTSEGVITAEYVEERPSLSA